MENITKAALAEIKKNRQRALFDAKEVETSLQQNPEYESIRRQLAAAGIALARARSDGQDATALESEYNALLAKKDAMLASLGYPEGVKPVFACAKCQDTGIFDNAPCSCVKKKINEIIKSKLKTSNVPAFRFDNFDASVVPNDTQRERLTKLYASMQKMCAKFPDTKHLNVVLSGKTGVGKTCVFSAVANDLVSRGFSVLFLTAFELNSRFLKYHTSPLSERALYMTDLIESDMLIIDDLGSEPMLKNVTTEYLLCVLSERTARGKHTFITTNLSSGDILSRYDERVFSRVFDKRNSLSITMGGDDLRLV